MYEYAESGSQLYSDFRILDKIEDREAAERYNSYLELIKKNTEYAEASDNPALSWFGSAKNILQTIFTDALKHYGIDQSTIPYQLCLCGSLAKKQATPFSDFDAIFIWAEPENENQELEIENFKRALAGLKNLFHRIFKVTHQFCPDIGGINPFQFHGTPNELFAKLIASEVGDVAFFMTAVKTALPLPLMARPSNSIHQLPFEQLASKFTDEKSDLQNSEEDLYQLLLQGYPGPENDWIHIKKHIFRPLDFFAENLRQEFEIDTEDGVNLSTLETINELMRLGCMSREFGDLIASIFKDAYRLRFAYHQLEQKEVDGIFLGDLKLDDLPMERLNRFKATFGINEQESANAAVQNLTEELINKVAIIRGIAEQRKVLIDAGADPKTIPVRITNLKQVRNIKLDLTPFVLENPSRKFFEQNRDKLETNMFNLALNKEGAKENIFSDLDIPDHLNFLVPVFEQCFKVSSDIVNGNEKFSYKFDEDKYEQWLDTLTKIATGDLFNAQGNFHFWLLKIFRKVKEGELQNEETKKILLAGYVAQLTAALTAKSEYLKNITNDQDNPKNSQILQNINLINQTHVCFITRQNKKMRKIINKHEVDYSEPLEDLAVLIDDMLELLHSVKSNTADPYLRQLLDKRTTEYQYLVKYILLISNSNHSKETKREFFHKASTHFQSDLHQLEQQITRHKSNIWHKLSQGFINIKMGIYRLWSKEKAPTVKTFLATAKQDPSFFALGNKIAAKESENTSSSQRNLHRPSS